MKRALLVPLLILASCSTSRGFDRGALSRHVRPETPIVTEEEIAKALAVRPQLSIPFKVAVYFRPSQGGLLTTGDKDAVLGRLDSLVGAGMLSQVIPVTDGIVTGDDLKSIRLAAARSGADAVLIVNGAGQVDRYENAASVLYWTIVGLFFVPGSRADALFLASATLWDVRNGYLYASAEAEGTGSATRPPVMLNSDRVLAEARLKGMKLLGEEIERHLRRMLATPADSRPAPRLESHPAEDSKPAT